MSGTSPIASYKCNAPMQARRSLCPYLSLYLSPFLLFAIENNRSPTSPNGEHHRLHLRDHIAYPTTEIQGIKRQAPASTRDEIRRLTRTSCRAGSMAYLRLFIMMDAAHLESLDEPLLLSRSRRRRPRQRPPHHPRIKIQTQ